MKIRIITDIHFGKDGFCNGKHTRLGLLGEDLLSSFINECNKDSETDLVLELGDLVEDQGEELDRENYNKMYQYFSELKCKHLHLPGNHDAKFLNDNFFLEKYNREKISFSYDVAGFKLVGLSTRVVNELPVVTSEDLEYFSEAINNSTLPVIVCSHYPIADFDVGENNGWYEKNYQRALLSNRKEVRQIISASKKVVCCLNGHLHANYLCFHDRIPYITIQSATDNYLLNGTPAASSAEVIIEGQRIVVNVNGNDNCKYDLSFPVPMLGMN